MELTGGTFDCSGGLIICSNATLTGNGVIRGAVTNYGTLLARSTNDVLTFTNYPGESALVNNCGQMLMTNGGSLKFGVPAINNAPFAIANLIKQGTKTVVQFGSVGGLTTIVECASSLDHPNWTPCATLLGTGETLSVTNLNTREPILFYRIHVLPIP